MQTSTEKCHPDQQSFVLSPGFQTGEGTRSVECFLHSCDTRMVGVKKAVLVVICRKLSEDSTHGRVECGFLQKRVHAICSS